MKQLSVIVAAAGLFIAMPGCGVQPLIQPLEVGTVAPTFELKGAVNGDKLTIDSLKGHIVVLNFWSTSCPVCLQEIDDLEQIHDSGKAKVVGIALDEDHGRVQTVIGERKIKYPVLLGDQELFERYDGFSIPYTLVLDRSQVVVKRFFGRMTPEDLDEVLRTVVEPNRVAMRGR